MGIKVDEIICGYHEEDGDFPEIHVVFHSVSDILLIKQDGMTIGLNTLQIRDLRKLVDRIDDD